MTNDLKVQVLLPQKHPIFVIVSKHLYKPSNEAIISRYFQKLIYPDALMLQPLSMSVGESGARFYFDDSKSAQEFVSHVDRFQNNFLKLKNAFYSLKESQRSSCFFQSNLSQNCHPILMEYLKDFGYININRFLSPRAFLIVFLSDTQKIENERVAVELISPRPIEKANLSQRAMKFLFRYVLFSILLACLTCVVSERKQLLSKLKKLK